MAVGTIEQIAEFLGESLRPLSILISGGDKGGEILLEHIGWELPDGVPSGITNLAAAVSDCFGAIAYLQSVATDLEDDEATEEDLLAAAAEALIAVTALLTALNDLKEDLEDEVPADVLAATGFSDEFARRVFDLGVITVASSRFPLVSGVLRFLGVFEESDQDADGASYQPEFTLRKVNWELLSTALTEPQALLAERLGWGTDSLDEYVLLDGIQSLVSHILGPATADPASEALMTAVAPDASTAHGPPRHIRFSLLSSDFLNLYMGVMVVPAPSSGGNPGLAFTLEADAEFEGSVEISSMLTLEVEATLDLTAGIAAVLRPGEDVEIRSGLISGSGEAIPDGDLRASLIFAQEDEDEPISLISIGDTARLEASNISLSLLAKARESGSEFGVEAALEGGRLVVEPDDGFLAELLPEGLGVDFDFSVGWSTSKGLYFGGSASLEVEIPVHLSLLDIVEVNAIYLTAAVDEDAFDVSASGSFSATLGPLYAAVDKLGVTATIRFAGTGGALGPVDVTLALKPPSGVGLSIDGQGFSGGGYLYFDAEKGEYAGVLELSFSAISLKAIGLLSTKLPDGSDGFSLLILITAEFTPIQLGMGFTLNGVGGLLGLHRTMKLDELREGVKTGALSSVLFPTDVVANADRILSDISAIFPVQKDQFVFGPMGKLGWGAPSLITAEIGLLIEITSPTQIAILGVLKIALPTEDEAIVRLQVNFLGTIEIEQGMLAFDASLYDSKILTFTLTGDMALRLLWGDDANFLMSVGGFHPSYEPPPLDLPTLTRIAIHLLSGNPSLTISAYFAVTSNTVQFGSSIDLMASEGTFSLVGRLSFDALFQFSPFYFIVTIQGSVALKAGGTTLFSVSVALALEGPTPWKAQGSATFKVLGIKASVSFSETWGETENTTLPDVAVLPLLQEALENSGNWSAALPDESLRRVTFNGSAASGDLVVDPAGTLQVVQKIVPLDLTIDCFGNQKPSDATYFKIDGASSGGVDLSTTTTKEQFAPAQFLSMTKSEKLSRKSFEKMTAGVQIEASGALQSSRVVCRDVTYETIVIDRSGLREALGKLKIFATRFSALIGGSWVSQSKLSFTKNAASFSTPLVKVGQEGFAVVHVSTLAPYDAASLWGSETEAIAAMNKLLKENPGLAGKVQVIPDSEIAA